MIDIRNLLNSGFAFGDEERSFELKVIYTNFTLTMAALSSPVISFLHLSQWGGYTSTLHGINCLIFSVYCGLLIFNLRRSVDYFPATRNLLLIGLFVIFTSNLILSVNENIRLLWFVIFLSVAQGLCDARTSRLSIFAVVALFATYFYMPFFEHSFSIIDILSSIFLLILVHILFYFYDYTITNTMQQLEITEKQALKLASAKTEFLSNMSHEIRTPLNGMLGFTDILLKDETEPDKVEYLSHIRSSGKFLMGIIGNILDLSRIEHGSMTIENRCFDIRKELKVMSLFAGRCTENGISYQYTIDDNVPEFVIGDSLRLIQILNNIVANAIKFTHKGGRIALTINGTDAPKAIHFEVSDSGIGISDEERTKIFSPFAQSNESIGRKYGGSGLGLSISQKLLKLMGSRLELDSRKGEGSRFYFNLSLSVCENDSVLSRAVKKPSIKSESFHILVVEDDKLSQKVAAALLKRLGHTVTIVDDGHEVMGAFDSESFDMVLMDIRMPIMDGVEATRLLRERGIDVPIIALTANVFKDDIEYYLSAGMDECISKPIDIKKLENLINIYSLSKQVK